VNGHRSSSRRMTCTCLARAQSGDRCRPAIRNRDAAAAVPMASTAGSTCARSVARCEGRIALWIALQTDIEEQSGLSLCSLAKSGCLSWSPACPMPTSWWLFGRLVEGTASGCYCSIVLVDPPARNSGSDSAKSCGRIQPTPVRGWPLQRVGGPCVMVAPDKVQVIMADVASDTRWRNSWRALAQAHGLRIVLVDADRIRRRDRVLALLHLPARTRKPGPVPAWRTDHAICQHREHRHRAITA